MTRIRRLSPAGWMMLGVTVGSMGAVWFVPRMVPWLVGIAASDVPATINHQGVVMVNGVRFTGTGAFKFALVDGAGENQWTHDGTQLGQVNAQPTGAAVSATVTDGVYSVRLGTAPMLAVPAELFTEGDLRLRIWFNDGVSGFEQLTPDHLLSTVPYAFTVADGAVSTAKLADGAVTLAKMGDDSAAPSPVLTWVNQTSQVIENAQGVQTKYLDPSFSVTVPAGKAYDYLLMYSGVLEYNYSDRNGSVDGFFGEWSAAPQGNGVDLVNAKWIMYSGYRFKWDPFGANWYWKHPYSHTWAFRLGPGTHNIRVRVTGYTDSSMQRVYVSRNQIQLVRLH